MSISSVPAGPEQASPTPPINGKRRDNAHLYSRVMRVKDAGLFVKGDLEGFMQLDDEVKSITSGIAGNIDAAAKAGIRDLRQIRNYELLENEVDTAPADLSPLDFEDDRDTEPGIPESCLGADESDDTVHENTDEEGIKHFAYDRWCKEVEEYE